MTFDPYQSAGRTFFALMKHTALTAKWKDRLDSLVAGTWKNKGRNAATLRLTLDNFVGRGLCPQL